MKNILIVLLLVLLLIAGAVTSFLIVDKYRNDSHTTLVLNKVQDPVPKTADADKIAPEPRPDQNIPALPKVSPPAPRVLDLFVPDGMVGDDYWIYLNGHIVSAPPRANANPINHDIVIVSLEHHGWELWNSHGLVLRMRDENYDNHLMEYFGHHVDIKNDTLHLFQMIELPLTFDKNTVEVAFSSPGSRTTFPFTITRKYVFDVDPGVSPTRVFVAVPDAWPSTPELPGAAAAIRSGPPDIDTLTKLQKAYLQDPMVPKLRAIEMRASRLSEPNGVVVLELPENQGGTREFDAAQIRLIAMETLARHHFPSHNDVAEASRLSPQFAGQYAEYDKIISTVDQDMNFLRKLAAIPTR